jgi:hypothetical protein
MPLDPQPHVSWIVRERLRSPDQWRWIRPDRPRLATPTITQPTPELIRSRMRNLARDQVLLCWWVPSLLSAVALFNFLVGLSDNKSLAALALFVVPTYLVGWIWVLVVQPLAIKLCWGIPLGVPLKEAAATKIEELEAR